MPIPPSDSAKSRVLGRIGVFAELVAKYKRLTGSPVLVLDQGVYPTRDGKLKYGRMLFLGLISQGYFYTDEGIIQFKSIPSQVTVPTYQTTQALSLGVVVKAKAISETMDEFFKKHPSSTPHESKAAKKK